MKQGILIGVIGLMMAGCVKVPTIVMVDRKTALEEQAGAGFSNQEGQVLQAGLSTRPAPYTRGQMKAKGVDSQDDVFNSVLRPYKAYSTDQAALDRLLTRRCAGEAMDATVVETPDTCAGVYNPKTATALLRRINRHRKLVLAWLSTQAKAKSIDEVRKVYRKRILKMMVCGGWYQAGAENWEKKKCE